MTLTVAELAEHITTRRRFYELALKADIELLRRAHGESVVQKSPSLGRPGGAPASEPGERHRPRPRRERRAGSPALSRRGGAATPQVRPPASAKRHDIAAALDRAALTVLPLPLSFVFGRAWSRLRFSSLLPRAANGLS